MDPIIKRSGWSIFGCAQVERKPYLIGAFIWVPVENKGLDFAFCAFVLIFKDLELFLYTEVLEYNREI